VSPGGDFASKGRSRFVATLVSFSAGTFPDAAEQSNVPEPELPDPPEPVELELVVLPPPAPPGPTELEVAPAPAPDELDAPGPELAPGPPALPLVGLPLELPPVPVVSSLEHEAAATPAATRQEIRTPNRRRCFIPSPYHRSGAAWSASGRARVTTRFTR